MKFVMTSSAFADQGEIPTRYTCDGADLSPPLRWSGAPPSTKAFALIVDDPDAPDPRAPQTTWVHWVVYNLPPSADALEENATVRGLPGQARQGINDWKRTGYGGPCPPVGRHRYFHRLYALDSLLLPLDNPTSANLLAAMKGHLMAQTQLVGTYQRKG
jgi:Raf kinase inhibitor-like YbhB/YbcL family protein